MQIAGRPRLTEQICLPAQKNLLDLFPGPRLLACSSHGLHSLDREQVLLFRRPPGLLASLWKVGEEDEAGYGEGESDDAVYDEQPAPW